MKRGGGVALSRITSIHQIGIADAIFCYAARTVAASQFVSNEERFVDVKPLIRTTFLTFRHVRVGLSFRP